LKITEVRVRDIRFPTSLDMDGSDALNLGDYSATYVTVVTDAGLTGDGLTFTNGRGNEIVVAAVRAIEHHVIGRRLSEITGNLRGFYRDLTVDKQLRWLGPEKGILHMATGALINAVWDLWAKRDGKPMWKHLADMTTSPTSPTSSRPTRRWPSFARRKPANKRARKRCCATATPRTPPPPAG
jgi:L-fuconate dehydratase